MKHCVIDGCNNEIYRNGKWCPKHHARWLQHGDPCFNTREYLPNPEKCIIDGCERKPQAKSMCQKHYNKWKRLQNVYRYWAEHSIHGHTRRGHTINITVDELETLARDSKNCYICGRELDWEYGLLVDKRLQKNLIVPSLDRMNNENNLSLTNIKICCLRCNTLKSDLPLEDFFSNLEFILSRKDIVMNTEKKQSL